jgi:internalin A
MERPSIQHLIAQADEEQWKKLNLLGMYLPELPSEIGSLTNLTILYFSDNQLSALPEAIGNLTSLTSFDLRNNQLSALPEAIGNLTSLTSFDLRNNQLSALPETIRNLTSLTSLYLNGNQFRILPEAIWSLTNLTSLYLSNNQLGALPEAIGNLTNLTSLYLSNNQLDTLPEAIWNLTSLTSLYLSNNQLDTLPEAIGNLTNLTSLYLSNNQLDTLPEAIGNLTNLTSLDISNNRLNLIQVPLEIVQKGGLVVRDYYRQRLEENVDYIYEAKLIIIGEGGSGKTSLANKLIDSKYELKIEGSVTPEKSTEGIDVLRSNFPHHSGNPFRINIWDFGGQAIYHATHQFFLTKRSLYLLVADTRQDNTDFNYWLEVVELLSEASPVLIIKNEKQDRLCQVNENQLRGRFPNLEKILSTNLFDNRGLTEISTAVQFYISQLPHIGTPLPKTWVRVRQALEADARNYINQTEFLALCDTHGFKRHEDKLQLSGYLHDLGVCLHFQDDPILKNWIILKPKWGTTAVYTVLDTPKIQKAFGCFTYANLKEIWADDQYTAMYDELLKLMMRFKLCYEIPLRPRTYIAPQLLSSNQPEYEWEDIDNLRLRYEYEFMPKGMLTRFTVEMHRLINRNLVWKEGVILKKEIIRTEKDSKRNKVTEAHAEVIEDYYKNEIRIRVSGFLKKDLLTSIRHEFSKIHDSYENLRHKEVIPCNCPTCKGSRNPHEYALKILYERIRNEAYEIECAKPPYHKVPVHSLIDDVIGNSSSDQPARNNRYTEEQSSLTNIIIHAGNSTVEDHSSKTNTFDLRKATLTGSGIATDNAQVTITGNTFTQNHDANIEELLNLITTLRQTATQFPADVQENVIIEIEDLETEVQKPADQRSIPRLKRSLIALFGIAGLIASPVAGMTDFTNNVLEIGNKLKIELPQLP